MKKYAVIFTCMNSRAVHSKVLDDMTTDAFLNVLRCFIAIRGPVYQLRSDQGSNFVGAGNQLVAAIKEMNVNKVAPHLRDHDCEFLLIPLTQVIGVEYGNGRLKPSKVHWIIS